MKVIHWDDPKRLKELHREPLNTIYTDWEQNEATVLKSPEYINALTNWTRSCWPRPESGPRSRRRATSCRGKVKPTLSQNPRAGGEQIRLEKKRIQRDQKEPGGIEIPAIQVEAETRQQPLVQPYGDRGGGQYDDCKFLLGHTMLHVSALPGTLVPLASARQIVGSTCMNLPSDVCNLMGIRSPGHELPGNCKFLLGHTMLPVSALPGTLVPLASAWQIAGSTCMNWHPHHHHPHPV